MQNSSNSEAKQGYTRTKMLVVPPTAVASIFAVTVTAHVEK
jgi:hypothetical protein